MQTFPGTFSKAEDSALVVKLRALTAQQLLVLAVFALIRWHPDRAQMIDYVNTM